VDDDTEGVGSDNAPLNRRLRSRCRAPRSRIVEAGEVDRVTSQDERCASTGHDAPQYIQYRRAAQTTRLCVGSDQCRPGADRHVPGHSDLTGPHCAYPGDRHRRVGTSSQGGRKGHRSPTCGRCRGRPCRRWGDSSADWRQDHQKSEEDRAPTREHSHNRQRYARWTVSESPAQT